MPVALQGVSWFLTDAAVVAVYAGHGGNTGGQTVGAVLTALSMGAISLRDAPRIVRKEACAGLAAGLLLGAALGPAVHYLGTPPPSRLVWRTARR